MINSLEVSGFRQFESLKIEDLKRINLFVGANNSGKTSILEALEILFNRFSPWSVMNGLLRRQEMTSLSKDDTTGKEYEVVHLFLGHRIEEGRGFSIKSGSGKESFSEIKCLIAQSTPDESRKVDLVGYDSLDVPKSLSLVGTCSSSGGEVGGWEAALLPATFTANPKVVRLAKPAQTAPKKHTFFLTGESIMVAQALVPFYQKSIRRNEKHKIIESLQIIDPGIVDIEFQVDEGSSQTSMNTILCKRDGEAGWEPISSMGDGIRRFLVLSLVTANLSGGYLFVDEIDTGLHHSIMPKMWEMVIETAKRLDLQVFATTHSQDCVRSLGRLCETKPEMSGSVQLHRLESGKRKTVPFSPEELAIAAREHVEVR